MKPLLILMLLIPLLGWGGPQVILHLKDPLKGHSTLSGEALHMDKTQVILQLEGEAEAPITISRDRIEMFYFKSSPRDSRRQTQRQSTPAPAPSSQNTLKELEPLPVTKEINAYTWVTDPRILNEASVRELFLELQETHMWHLPDPLRQRASKAQAEIYEYLASGEMSMGVFKEALRYQLNEYSHKVWTKQSMSIDPESDPQLGDLLEQIIFFTLPEPA